MDLPLIEVTTALVKLISPSASLVAPLLPSSQKPGRCSELLPPSRVVLLIPLGSPFQEALKFASCFPYSTAIVYLGVLITLIF